MVLAEEIVVLRARMLTFKDLDQDAGLLKGGDWATGDSTGGSASLKSFQ